MHPVVAPIPPQRHCSPTACDVRSFIKASSMASPVGLAQSSVSMGCSIAPSCPMLAQARHMLSRLPWEQICCGMPRGASPARAPSICSVASDTSASTAGVWRKDNDEPW